MSSFFILMVLTYGVVFGKCENDKWWEHTSIYEIYPRSFKDSDGDGIGDLKGITSKLDYLKELETQVIRITHLYKTSNRDFDRYEILNHKEIDSLIGTMEDFEELVKEAHKKGLKIMIDFVPNHTSDSHPWFLNSIHKHPIYSDYYIWKNGSQNGFPNDWKSVFGYSAWQNHWERKEYYYHVLSSNQPDLNLRNPKVVEELKDILRFWMSKMVDGFFLTEASYLLEDDQLRDSYRYHKDFSESGNLVYKFKKEIEEYEDGLESDRILVALTDGFTLKSLNGSEGQQISPSHLVFRGPIADGFETTYFSLSFAFYTVYVLNGKFTRRNGEIPEIWAGDSHGNRRIFGILDEEISDVLIGFTALMPGVMYTYYGSELGMHGRVEPNNYYYVEHLGYFDQRPDALYAERLPMQWNNEDNAGFTTALKPWMDNNPEYWIYNVKSEEVDPNSHLSFYKKLKSLRKTPTLMHGEIENYDVDLKIYSFSRLYPGYESYIVISNFDCETQSFDLETKLVTTDYGTNSKVLGKAVANVTSLFIVAGSGNALHKPGDVITRNSDGKLMLTMRPRSQVILSDQNIINKPKEKEGNTQVLDFSNTHVRLAFLLTAIGLIILNLKWIFN